MNKDPCSEPCLCKVRGGVKDDPEFPLRCPRKATHSIDSGDQFLSKAARFKYNFASLHLPEKHGVLSQSVSLALYGHPSAFWVPSGQWPSIPEVFL